MEEQEIVVFTILFIVIHVLLYFFDIKDLYEQKQLEIMQDEYMDDEQYEEEVEDS